MPKIRINTTDGSTLEFELEAERYRIGRAQDNDLVVPDGSVSSYHGEIFVTPNGIDFHDLGSTNGTHVNGQRVEKASLSHGEEFRIGSCPVVYEGDAPASAPASADEGSAPAPTSIYEDDASEPDFSNESAGSGWEPATVTNSAAAITGLGATPCPAHMRQGFGPKAKKKQAGSGLMILGILGIVSCIAGVVMILQMGS
ncbi:FHA domain-containing protein [Phragmitibacter flavus]|uniref:FHA domain-containing protein n=1 Tax=Phragmitibacter flavus TaxID=2576071 RepID=A0A5R8K8T8_9BACT|nr:FHA domain-containing protein [Phragmitibacter flavus]TLD68742.1 FHA domain-containing protein [Phragmitibacter flavus]